MCVSDRRCLDCQVRLNYLQFNTSGINLSRACLCSVRLIGLSSILIRRAGVSISGGVSSGSKKTVADRGNDWSALSLLLSIGVLLPSTITVVVLFHRLLLSTRAFSTSNRTILRCIIVRIRVSSRSFLCCTDTLRVKILAYLRRWSHENHSCYYHDYDIKLIYNLRIICAFLIISQSKIPSSSKHCLSKRSRKILFRYL